jgi:gluconolactonase
MKTSIRPLAMKTTFFSSVLLLGTSVLLSAADFDIRTEAEFRKIIPADAKIEKLADGFGFTEGPVWVSTDGGYLIFSDIPKNQLKKWTKAGGVTTFREPSRNINGNTLDRQGRLVSAEHSGRQISVTEKDGTAKTVVDSFDGKKFNSPNDVVVKSDGTFWFTDPPYGLPRGEKKEQEGNYVYRFDPATKKTTTVVKDFDMPNGLCFSPDETRLYVADSGKPHHIRVFDVKKDGVVSDGKVFAVIDKGGPDGIRCDADGRIWSSSGAGADIFAPDGSLIGKINTPKSGANLCFGGQNGTTLFITARDGLYAVETKVKGAK